MINRRTQRGGNAVERLHQSGFAAPKGVDETASVLDTTHIAHSNNMVVNLDGSLSLRKPVVCLRNFSEPTYTDEKGVNQTVDASVIGIYSLFDDNYTLVVRKDDMPRYYFSILDDVGVPKSVRLCWRKWVDYSLKTKLLDYNYGQYISNAVLDFRNVSVSHTPTSTVCTGVYVDIVNSMFYSGEHSDLCYKPLYDLSYSGPEGGLYKPRTITITLSDDDTVDFDIVITTPDVNTLSTSDKLQLDINLDLDNPYAIRDVYNTSAPTVNGIIAYVPTVTANGRTDIDFSNSLQNSKEVSRSVILSPKTYIGTNVPLNKIVAETSVVNYTFHRRASGNKLDFRFPSDMGISSKACDLYATFGGILHLRFDTTRGRPVGVMSLQRANATSEYIGGGNLPLELETWIVDPSVIVGGYADCTSGWNVVRLSTTHGVVNANAIRDILVQSSVFCEILTDAAFGEYGNIYTFTCAYGSWVISLVKDPGVSDAIYRTTLWVSYTIEYPELISGNYRLASMSVHDYSPYLEPVRTQV